LRHVFLKVCVKYRVDDCCVCQQSTSRLSEMISEVMLQWKWWLMMRQILINDIQKGRGRFRSIKVESVSTVKDVESWYGWSKNWSKSLW
jgi:hypothetical protein